MTPTNNNKEGKLTHEEAMGLNRATRRRLAKFNGVDHIPGSTKPYEKDKKKWGLTTFLGHKK